LQRYYPGRAKPNKLNLPGLPTSIYGLHELSGDPDRYLYLCEGVFDLVALDYHLGHSKRDRYDLLATPGGFQDRWAEHIRGRKVRSLYDNDDTGRKHTDKLRALAEQGVPAELQILQWPEGYPKDVNALVTDPRYKNVSVASLFKDHGALVTAQPKLLFQHGRRGTPDRVHLAPPPTVRKLRQLQRPAGYVQIDHCPVAGRTVLEGRGAAHHEERPVGLGGGRHAARPRAVHLRRGRPRRGGGRRYECACRYE
jgi:hypothetical protein